MQLDTMTNEELCKLYQTNKDDAIYNYMLTKNIGLVSKYFNKTIAKYPNCKDELLQIGRIAIWKAMLKFDESKNTKFTTYLWIWLKSEYMRSYIRELYPIKIPVYLLPYIREIRDVTSNPALKPVESLDQTVYSESSGKGVDMLVSDTVPSTDLTPEEEIEHKDNIEYLNKLLIAVGGREKVVIELYYGLNGNSKHTLEEIGDMYSITRERVRQIIEKGLMKLKKKLKYKYPF